MCAMVNSISAPEHSEITVYDILLYNQWQCKNDEKNDVLLINYRDDQGVRHVEEFKNPNMDIYFCKPEYRGEFRTPREYLPIDKCYKVRVPAKFVVNEIYREMQKIPDPVGTRLKRIYDTANQTGQYRSKKEVFKWPYTLMSDSDVVTSQWIQMGYHYNLMHGHVIDKCFADIENDIYKMTSSEQAANMDPVNACTLIFRFDENGPHKKEPTHVFTYLLRNYKRYPQQEEFEKHILDFEKECHEKFDKQTIIKSGKVKKIDTYAEYHIVLYDTEQELLQAIFDTINSYEPDICEFWNMPYDMPKMRARMEILGMDYVKTMSNSKYYREDIQFAQFHMDNRPVDISNRNSYIRMTSPTQYVDQMQNYAVIRKGRKSYGSNRLDNIAKIELGMGKWSFKKGIDVTNACIYDYWNFVLYNIRDVWCQVLIDYVTNDTMALIYDMNQMNCPLYHLGKQTKYQKYIYYCWYLKKGFVPGNNINVDYSKYNSADEQERVAEIQKKQKLRELLDKQGYDQDDIEEMMQDPDILAEADLDLDDLEESLQQEKSIEEIADEEVSKVISKYDEIFRDSVDRKLPLPGGAVGNPDFNSANGAELIPGIPSKHVFHDAMDEDYASEYPWAKYTRSLSRSTQIGRLIIPEKISDYQCILPLGQKKRETDIKKYIPGAEFTSDYISQDYLSFGACWFNLPLADECNDLIDEMLKHEEE